MDPAVLAARIAAIADDPRGPETHFGEFWFDSPLPPDLDPSSPEYRDAVLMQFRAITGKLFLAQPREDAFDPQTVDAFAASPWPYNTGDARQVGAVLAGVGHAISRIGARPGHRCLVVGAEWGHVTLALAQMGCATTAVDDHGRFATLLEERARRSHVECKVLRATVLDLPAAVQGERFDFVIFRDALGECYDPAAAIDAVRDNLLAPGGRLALVGEPLVEDLPYPWGINPLGDGLWTACRSGRLKLAFRPSTLLQMLDRAGFDAELHVCEATPLGNTLVACRRPSASIERAVSNDVRNPSDDDTENSSTPATLTPRPEPARVSL